MLCEATDLHPVILHGIGWSAENLLPDPRKERYLVSIYGQGDEEPIEGVPVEVVGVCYCDMLEGDVPECHVLRAIRICAALLMWMEAESEGVELNMVVGFGQGACGGMSMDVRIRLRVDKHAGGP